MSTSGPNIPGTGANDTGVGTAAWSSPSNITASDDTYSTVSTLDGLTSNYLKGTNCGFAIPSTDVIDGIELTIHRKSPRPSGADGTYDEHVKLVKGGTVVGDNKAATSTQWPIAEASVTYGGPTDLWGTTWLYSDINASNFGAVLGIEFINNNEGIFAASVDTFQLTIYHSAGENGPENLKTANGNAKSATKTLKGQMMANVKNINGVT